MALPGWFLLLFILLEGAYRAGAQTPEVRPRDSPQTSTEQPTAQAVFKVTTREVVVDVIAVDRHDRNLVDLRQDEFVVFEIGADHRRTAQAITSARFVPPLLGAQEARPSSSLHVRLGSGCAEATTPHYSIAYHVSEGEIRDGEHTILITSSREGTKLSYGSHYFVAGSKVLPSAKPETDHETEARLFQAACFHSQQPLALPLLAHRVETQGQDVLHYQLTIPPPAIPLLALAMDRREIHLEYAACSFDQNGRPLRFLHNEDVRTLTSSEFVQATIHGLSSLLAVAGDDHPAAIRFVVRDGRTGHAGVVLAETANALAPGQLTPDEAKAVQSWKQRQAIAFGGRDDDFPPVGPIGSFGSLEPRAGAMCGDVYELTPGTTNLPNFWSLNSIGTLYADVLDVPHQQFGATGGVPGVTRATEWFGIDYHGAFQVKTRGVYEFSLISDDGAKLYIDDELVVDADSIHNVQTKSGKVTLEAGAHTLHLPYFQGPLRSLALQLFVKAPGGSRQLFDVRGFAGDGSGTPSQR